MEDHCRELFQVLFMKYDWKKLSVGSSLLHVEPLPVPLDLSLDPEPPTASNSIEECEKAFRHISFDSAHGAPGSKFGGVSRPSAAAATPSRRNLRNKALILEEEDDSLLEPPEVQDHDKENTHTAQPPTTSPVVEELKLATRPQGSPLSLEDFIADSDEPESADEDEDHEQDEEQESYKSTPKRVDAARKNDRAPTPSGAGFSRQRERRTKELFVQFNKTVFGGRLPADMDVKWSKRLNTTAGQALFRGGVNNCKTASIELSTKVLDSDDKLRSTLAHEMCHCAAWVIDGVKKPPHGASFKFWARKVESVFSDIEVTTCHNYEIQYKFRFQCQQCSHTFGRHSNSIDVEQRRCGRCHGSLVLLGQFNTDGTPRKPRPAPPFANFVKENYAHAKAANPATPHKDIMKILSTQYKSTPKAPNH